MEEGDEGLRDIAHLVAISILVYDGCRIFNPHGF